MQVRQYLQSDVLDKHELVGAAYSCTVNLVKHGCNKMPCYRRENRAMRL